MALWRETTVAVKVLPVSAERRAAALDEEFPEDAAVSARSNQMHPFADALSQVGRLTMLCLLLSRLCMGVSVLMIPRVNIPMTSTVCHDAHTHTYKCRKRR